MDHFKVLLPDASTISSDEKGTLPLWDLSTTAKTAMVLPQFRSLSLVSIGQLCDDNCKVLLTKKKLYAIKEVEIILEGTRNLNNGLWHILIQKKTVTSEMYVTPNIYPVIYPALNIKTSVNVITCKPPSKAKTHKLLKEFQVFSSLIESNLCDQIIDQQIKQDARTYTPISITNNNPSFTVIVRKKETYIELS